MAVAHPAATAAASRRRSAPSRSTTCSTSNPARQWFCRRPPARCQPRTAGRNTTRYIHGSTGIHAQQNPGGDWRWLLQDGLGSVRALANTTDVIAAQQYSPYGVPLDTMTETDFGFTGELTDDNDLVYLRARYLNPSCGSWLCHDLEEGEPDDPMSMNAYLYVNGSPISRTDPTGLSANSARTDCGGTCDDLGNRLNGVIVRIVKRIEELLEDRCRMYERDVLKEPVPGFENCGPGDWIGHLDAISQAKGQLQNLLGCKRNGVKRFDPATGPSAENCVNHVAYSMAIAAMNAQVPDQPNRPIESASSFSLLPQSAEALAPIPQVTATPLVMVQPSIQPQRPPEPGAPYGRGAFASASVIYPGWAEPFGYAIGIAIVGVAASCVAPVAASAMAAGATLAGGACALNPVLCQSLVRAP